MSAAQNRGLLAMFTDTPQLKGWEAAAARRDARKVERERHGRLRLQVLAAYHDALACSYLAMSERLTFGVSDPDAVRLKGQHELAATKLAGLFDDFMRLPASGKIEREERRKLMRKVAEGVGGSSCGLSTFRDREPRWLALLTEQQK
jgi:hypothetical protein